MLVAVRTSRRAAALALVAIALPLAGPPTALAHPPGTTERVSVSSQGAAGDNDSLLASVSGNGRYVAFWSYASTLVADDTNGTSDVFVHDRATGATERVSVDSRERQATGAEQDGVLDTNFGRPAITPDGRYVAFASSATNLVKGDRNGTVDVFVRDRAAGTTERVSMAGRRTEANGESSHPVITPDGRFVAFTSYSDNLVPGDTNFASDVFLLDRSTGAVQRVSVSSAEEQASTSSGGASITPDGRFVAFGSDASNLVPGEPDDAAGDIYLRDVLAGTTEGIATNATGTLRHTGAPVLSADATLVAFHSWDDSIVPGDTNGSYDVFVLDRTTGAVERVSVDSTGAQGLGWSLGPAMTPDGRFVAFGSEAANLVPGDGNEDFDVFLHDRDTHSTVRVSVRSDGTETGLELASMNPSISDDGRVVAFESEGALVDGDTEFPVDVFVHAHP